MDLGEFTEAVDRAIQEIRASERADGVRRIYIPGEIEFEKRAERLARGIPIPEPVVRDFIALGRELNVPFPQS